MVVYLVNTTYKVSLLVFSFKQLEVLRTIPPLAFQLIGKAECGGEFGQLNKWQPQQHVMYLHNYRN